MLVAISRPCRAAVFLLACLLILGPGPAAAQAPFLVKDINPGRSLFPSHLTVFNGALFLRTDDGVNGSELWTSDDMPDAFEIANGLDPLDPADAGADLDGDGASNLLEFLADTDPEDPDSVPDFCMVSGTVIGVTVADDSTGGDHVIRIRTAALAGHHYLATTADDAMAVAAARALRFQEEITVETLVSSSCPTDGEVRQIGQLLSLAVR